MAMNISKELIKKIDTWIEEHSEQLVKDTCKLIRIPSVSDKESDIKPFGQECKDALLEYIRMGEEYGLKSRNSAGYVAELYNPDNAEKQVRIGLMGHLDVVPAGDNWIYPPYEGIVKDNWIIGRGSQDNKGPCLTAMYAVLCLRDLSIDLSYDVCSLAGTDEESGMADAEYYSKCNGIPDLIIVTDSGFPICYAERGIASGWLESALPHDILSFKAGTATNQIPDRAIITLKKTDSLLKKLSSLETPPTYRVEEKGIVIEAEGIAGHIAFSRGAINAIGVLFNLLIHNDLLEDEQDRRIFKTLAAIASSIDGGIFDLTDNVNLISSVCYGCGMSYIENNKLKLSFNIRCPIELDEAAVMKKVEKFAAENNLIATETRILPSNYFPEERPVIQTLNDVFNDVIGMNLKPQIFVAGTHARKLPNAVAYGPGIPDKAYYPDTNGLFPVGHGSCHMPDEAQSIPALLEALKIYILGVIALDGKELTK